MFSDCLVNCVCAFLTLLPLVAEIKVVCQWLCSFDPFLQLWSSLSPYKLQNRNRGVEGLSKLHLSIVTLFKLHLEQMLVNYELVINLLFPEHVAMCLVSYLRIKDISSSKILDDSLKRVQIKFYCSTCYLCIHIVNSFQGLCQWILLVLFEVKVDYPGRSC